jgi:myo-inositol 2-dehydrogenase/D-chiro-inositol 1-dehydrogenase
MRIGLVGVGRIGAFHARTLAGLDGVEQLMLFDSDPARARAAADGSGAVVATSLRNLLATVDGVVIATPTATHGDLIRGAAAHGRPVFCEKPVAAGIAETQAVLADVAAAGVPLQVGFQRRFDPGYRAIRDAVRSGSLGWLHTMRSCTADPAPPSTAYIATSGGIFHDCMIHDFDSIRWMTGREVVRVYAMGANRGGAHFTAVDDVDTAAAVLTLDDGTVAVCTATRYNGAGYDVRLEVCGSAGTLVAGLEENTPLVSTAGVSWPAGPPFAGFQDRFHDAYVSELMAFCDVVTGRMASPCDGREALEALAVAEAATWSRREGRAVALDEVRGLLTRG